MTAVPSSTAPRRFAALHYRDFRLLWIGQLISTIGSQMQLIAVNWQVYRLLSGTTYRLDFLACICLSAHRPSVLAGWAWSA